MIYKAITQHINYAVKNDLICEDDRICMTNLILGELGLKDLRQPETTDDSPLEDILKSICDFAIEQGIIEDSTVYRDLFDTKIMGILTPRPSEIRKTFYTLYEQNPKSATDWYFKLCRDTDYIRCYRIAKDMKWVSTTEYGDIDITINLSKPEKDPKAIAAAKSMAQVGYPKCQLCRENEGYMGRVDHPARQNHRIIPVTVNGKPWLMQYSPYVYYNEHCIVFDSEHNPMSINPDTFKKLLSFVEQFPHYFVGSNADLPIVGGSILTHDHFQGGNYTFAMAKAPIETEIVFEGFEDVKAGIVKWPMSVIRISSPHISKLCSLAEKILMSWRNYTDQSAFIYAFTDGQPHNTITPIARKVGENFQLDLVLRNNITTKEHPFGVYHPHAELHHIKKENIGLIEVMGLAVLPARLKTELMALADAIINGEDLSKNQLTASHAEWAYAFIPKYNITKDNINDIIQTEVGKVFAEVLEHAGVFKRSDEGKQAFIRFCKTVR